ncbi:LysE family translocator [Endozoicomonas lisbonensis]
MAGIAIAAPVGPIGLLCLRRTLNDGRLAGLASGLGAATADGLYGMIVAAGLTASGLLDSHAGQLSIAGGLLIAFLGMQGLRSFLKNNKNSEKAAASPAKTTILAAFSTTFILTIINPMTILMFAGLIAGLNTVVHSESGSAYWLVSGIFLGSTIWWLFLVHIALIARSRLTTAVTRWFDFASGTLLLLWGLWIALKSLT